MQQIDHRVIKLLVGLIAIFLAFFMQLVSGEELRSISESYHYRARDWFVGLLFAVSALFLSFSGENTRERVLTILASILAAIVAIAPCACDREHGTLSKLHFPAAALLFAILGYFCWRFRRTAKSKVTKYPEAGNRVRVYTSCLAGMIICGLMAVTYALSHESMDERFPSYVFWLEALGLVSFGVSWLAASRTLPIVTSVGERFSIRKGCAPDDDGPAQQQNR
jgi:Na+/proline symporter